jgi:nicotinamide-nucleotide amidase
MARRPPPRARPPVADEILDPANSSILDLLDHLLNKGVMLNGDITMGVAGVDLIYLRLASIFCATDRLFPAERRARRRHVGKAATREEAESMLAPLVAEVGGRLRDAVFTVDDEELEVAVGRLLRAAGASLACAESLTGGGVGARLTAVPGASGYFLGSAVVYTAEAKRTVLGVSQQTIDGPGVVSEECALEMAAGARRVFGADVGLALTGAAGPEPHGGAEPGTVWVALDAEDVRHARGFRVPGERFRVRRWAEQAGLDLVRRHLEGVPLPDSDL